jgi:hypothetical protein
MPGPQLKFRPIEIRFEKWLGSAAGCPRDDKKERVVARKGRLLEERVVTPQAFLKSNLDRSAELSPGRQSWVHHGT